VAYVGNQPARGQWRKLSDISSGFNGVITTFTTSVPPGTSEYFVTAGSASQLLISLGGVIQQPDVDYTVSTNSITFTTPPTGGLSFFGVLCGDALNVGAPADGSVTSAKLAGGLSVGLTGGSASTPSLFFTGDANTGLFSPTADTIAFTEGGVEAMRIDSSGRVGIGTTSPTSDATQVLHVASSGSGTNALVRVAGNNGTGVDLISGGDSIAYLFNRDNTALVFGTNNTERGRWDNAGRFLVGTSTFSGNAGIQINPNNGNCLQSIDHITGTPSGEAYLFFNFNGSSIGNITQNGTTAVAYNTSSDYRLKENVTSVPDGIARLQQLKPSRFNFIADPDHTVDGFLAHEVQTVVPEAITGEKDAVDDNGNPIYQGIDQSKLVPLLTAALQEAIAKIEDLEGRLTAAGL
jgi:hypothetical protein